MRENAYAKLNISLDVTEKRPDGYHDMVMVMQTVSLADELDIVLNDTGRVQVRSNLHFIPSDERNLAVKAALCFLAAAGKAGQGMLITLTKRIPVGAGMAGGSADAAAVLRALPDHRADVIDEARLTAARREALVTGLQAMGLYVYPSRAAFVLVDLGRPAEPIAAALKDQGILVRQCMDFSGVDDGNHLRLAVKDDRSNARLLAALREALTCAANH